MSSKDGRTSTGSGDPPLDVITSDGVRDASNAKVICEVSPDRPTKKQEEHPGQKKLISALKFQIKDLSSVLHDEQENRQLLEDELEASRKLCLDLQASVAEAKQSASSPKCERQTHGSKQIVNEKKSCDKGKPFDGVRSSSIAFSKPEVYGAGIINSESYAHSGRYITASRVFEEFRDVQVEFGKQLKALSNQCSDKDEEISRLSQKVAVLIKQICQLETELDESRDAFHEKSETVLYQESKLKQTSSMINQRELKVAKLLEVKEILQQKCQKLKEKNAKLKEENGSLNEIITHFGTERERLVRRVLAMSKDLVSRRVDTIDFEEEFQAKDKLIERIRSIAYATSQDEDHLSEDDFEEEEHLSHDAPEFREKDEVYRNKSVSPTVGNGFEDVEHLPLSETVRDYKNTPEQFGHERSSDMDGTRTFKEIIELYDQRAGENLNSWKKKYAARSRRGRTSSSPHRSRKLGKERTKQGGEEKIRQGGEERTRKGSIKSVRSENYWVNYGSENEKVPSPGIQRSLQDQTYLNNDYLDNRLRDCRVLEDQDELEKMDENSIRYYSFSSDPDSPFDIRKGSFNQGARMVSPWTVSPYDYNEEQDGDDFADPGCRAEGLLLRKHDLENYAIKSRERSWHYIYAVHADGILDFYENKDYVLTGLTFNNEEPLNLTNAIVAPLTDYPHRNFVFRVQLENGARFLFQARDEREMMYWVCHLSSRTDGGEMALARQTLFGPAPPPIHGSPSKTDKLFNFIRGGISAIIKS